MEQIIEVEGHRYMLGLQWLQLQGKDPMLAAKTKAKAGKTPYGIIRSIDRGDGSSSFQVAMTAMKPRGPVNVGAAHLVNIHPSVIGIEKLDQDLYWMCVADSGRVLPGYDIVLSDSEVKMLLSELSSEFELDYMVMAMDEQVAATFGISSYTGESPIKSMGVKTPSDEIKLRNLAGLPSTVYLGGLIGVVAIGFGGFMMHQKNQAKIELERMIAIQQAAQEEKERLAKEGNKENSEEEILKRAKEEEIQWLRDDFNTLRLIPAMTQIHMLNNHLPSYFMGWRLSEIVFSKDNPKEMISIWSREGGLILSLNELFIETGETVAFSSDFSTARVGHAINLGSEGIADILDYIDKNRVNHQVIADLFYSSDTSFSMEVLNSSKRKEPIEGIADTHMRELPQLMMRKRDFTAEVNGKDSFLILKKRLNSVKNLLPERISVEKSEKESKFVIKGILYEK